MWWVWRWLLLVAALTAKTVITLPVPDEIHDTSTKILGSSVVTSVSVVMGREDSDADTESDIGEVTDDLPASTVDMLRPDGFQFYTVDEKGQLITRQMTDAEIQSIIAAAGGPLPIGTFDSEKNGENATGEMKVADVVQNVQNVLKEELNKPPVAMGTVPTIPGHASAEWSSILPSILGGDTESAPVSLPETEEPALPVIPVIQDTMEEDKIVVTPSINPEEPPLAPSEVESTKETIKTTANETPGVEIVKKPVEEDTKPAKKPEEDEEAVTITEEKPIQEEVEQPTERPMVLVPVITAESVHSTIKQPSSSSGTKPVYQILNTISADKVKTENAQSSTEKISVTDAAPVKEEEKVEESGAHSADEKPAIEITTEEKPAVIPDTTEVEIASSLEPKPQKETEEPTKDAEKTGLDSDAEKQTTPDLVKGTPSITLEAPAVTDEVPIKISAPEKTEKPDTSDAQKEKPAVQAQENVENSTPAKVTTEKETLTEAMKEKVSEIVSMFPGSINSIVEELISENANKAPEKLEDEVKVEIPQTVTASSGQTAEPLVSDGDTKVEEVEGEIKVTDSSNRVEKPAVLNTEEPEKPDDKTESVIPPSQPPTKTDAIVETIFEMLPEIISEPTEASTDLKTTSEVVAPTKNIESETNLATTLVPEAQTIVEKIETTTTKIAESQEEVTKQSFISVELTAPAVPEQDLQAPDVSTSSSTEDNVSSGSDEKNDSGSYEAQTTEEKEKPLATEEKKPETLFNELADSVSSMISQVSDVLPSMVPIPHESEDNDQSVKRIEDSKVKPEVSQATSDLPKPTEADKFETAASAAVGETSAEIVTNKVELLPEASKPAETELEAATMIADKPEPTKATSSDSEVTKIWQTVPTETAVKVETQKPEVSLEVELPAATITESESVVAQTSGVDSTKPEAISVPAISEDGKIEKVKIEKVDSESKPQEPQAAKDGTKPETPEASGSSDSEAPIVRIDITEAKPTDVSLPVTSTDANDGSTESPVVRIQTTNPVAIIDQMINAAPDQAPPADVEALALPEDKIEAITAQNIGSSLIAGPQPENLTGIKSSEETSSADPTVNPILENSVPIANTDLGTKMTSTADKVASEPSVVAKPEVEIKETKVPEPEVEIPQRVTKPKPTPAASEEGNVKSPATETEAPKISGESNEPKPTVEKQTETQSMSEKVQETKVPSAGTGESEVSVKPVAKVDLPISNEKIQTSEKSEEPVASNAEKIAEPSNVSTVINSKDETVSTEASVKVPSEVVVSTTVDVVTEKDTVEKSPESTDKDSAKTPAPEEKPELISKDSTVAKLDDEIPVATSVKTESKPEVIQAATTATKITEIPTPTATQSDAQTTGPVAAVSTAASENVEKELPKPEPDTKTNNKDSSSPSQPEIETPVSQEVVGIQSTEVAEKESEASVVKYEKIPAPVGSSSDVKGSEDSASKPVPIPVPEIKPSSSDEKPKKEVPSDASPTQVTIKETEATKVKPEASNDTGADKDQTSPKPVAPVVRIDMSPEKNQSETSIILNGSPDAPEKTSGNDEKVATSVTKKPASEEKLPEKSEVVPAVETTVIQSGKPESTIVSESSSIAPTKTESNSNKQGIKKDEAQSYVEKKPEESSLKKPQNDVEETIVSVDSQLPLTSAAPTAPIEESPDTVKPVVKTDESNNPAKTQEIRIQVNDTAVLVTKHPISQNASKGTENIEKKPAIKDSPTSTKDKIEPPSQSLQPAKESNNSNDKSGLEETEKEEPKKKPQIQNLEKVEEVVNTSVQETPSDIEKKPVIDPYVKLGEPQENLGIKKVSIPSKNKDKEGSKLTEDKWTLIPQSESNPITKPHTAPTSEAPPAAQADKSEEESQHVSVPLDAHQSAINLAESTRNLDKDIESFSSLCNELAFSFWTATNKGLSTERSLALSPFGMTSMLAMVFLGARGPTSGQMNDILKLDDVVTFNPHLVFQNVSDSVNLARGQGIANAAFVRELFADRSKAGRLLPFYKERAQQFYDGHIEEVNFATISDLVRRRTNLLIRRQTGGRIRDFVKGNVMPLRSPLAALSANVFQTNCAAASSEGRDGEMYFAVLPAVRQRKLVPVPATVWKSGVLAGYEPGLDATVISLGGIDSLVSTIFLLPGQQGLSAPGDSLDHLERRLLEGAFTQGVWDRLLKTLIPRMGLEVQVPKFSHRSIVNATAALKRMGLEDLFSRHADLKGINGVGNDLHLADMVQINLFSTCGDEAITGGRHHVEIYPASPLRGARAEKIFVDSENREAEEEEEEEEEEFELSVEKDPRTRRSVDVREYIQQSRDSKRSVSLSAEDEFIEDERSERSSFGGKERTKESKGKQSTNPLLKLDRPFLYFVRHNPTGMILHMGRFNPRLMP